MLKNDTLEIPSAMLKNAKIQELLGVLPPGLPPRHCRWTPRGRSLVAPCTPSLNVFSSGLLFQLQSIEDTKGVNRIRKYNDRKKNNDMLRSSKHYTTNITLSNTNRRENQRRTPE
jgi:hypothetical protein